MDASALQRQIAGTVDATGSPDYELTRREMVWNALLPDRRPELIVRVANEADVVTTVQFAREHGSKIAVRGGGHNWYGVSLRNGGLLLDLGHLDGVSVDPNARTAAAQPAVTGRDLSHRLSAHNLAFPYGHCSTIPLSGFVLSGGLGWNGGSWGPACFNVDAIDVVTADGQLLRASADHHPDLLWAARGAGAGFFGAVTRFHLRLHQLPQRITTSTYVYPLACLETLAEWTTRVSSQVSPNVELALAIAGAAHSPHGEPVCIVIATAFADTDAEAAAALAPTETCPAVNQCLVAERNQLTTFDGLFDSMDRFFPAGHRVLAESFWSNDSLAHILTAIPQVIEQAPPRALLLCVSAPPAAAPMPDAALSIAAPTFLLCYAIWNDAAEDGRNHAWHRGAVEALEPFAVGHYIGESDIVTSPRRAPFSFAPTHWARLRALREKYDPQGVFYSYFDGK